MKIIWIILFSVNLLVKVINGQNLPQIPCPELFRYNFDGQKWYGFLQIPSPQLGEKFKVNVEMSLKASLPTVSFLFFFGFFFFCVNLN